MHYYDCPDDSYISPIQYSLLSSIIGILLIDNLSLDEQNSFGNFLVTVGQSMLTAAAQGQLIESSNNNDSIRRQLEQLRKQIDEIERNL